MNLEKCTIDDIRDENTRKHFNDLMKSEGPVRVIAFGYIFAVVGSLLMLLLMYIGLPRTDRHILFSNLNEFIGFALIMGTLFAVLYYFFLAHATLFKIKIKDRNYPSAVKNWLMANNFHKQELDESVHVLKPDFKFLIFNTILFTVEGGYAIILAPFSRLRNFAKVFE
ncbi:MAG: hypothetical protein ACYC0V_15120 [Armatimonadota bacterium]